MDDIEESKKLENLLGNGRTINLFSLIDNKSFLRRAIITSNLDYGSFTAFNGLDNNLYFSKIKYRIINKNGKAWEEISLCDESKEEKGIPIAFFCKYKESNPLSESFIPYYFENFFDKGINIRPLVFLAYYMFPTSFYCLHMNDDALNYWKEKMRIPINLENEKSFEEALDEIEHNIRYDSIENPRKYQTIKRSMAKKMNELFKLAKVISLEYENQKGWKINLKVGSNLDPLFYEVLKPRKKDY
jgi:hypothetical protein